MFKKIAILFAVVMALPLLAKEKGAPIFQDGFNTKETFAENWVVGKGWNGKVNSSEGEITFPKGGEIQMRRDTPANFCAEMEVTINGRVKGVSGPDGFCGFRIGGFRFTISYNGNYWLASAPKSACGFGLGGKIANFQLGKPVKISLTREVENGVAKYLFRINGKEALRRVCELTEPNDGKYQPLKIFSYKVDMTIDNFALFTLKGSGESPNLVINSGFEHALGDAPPYYFTAIPDLKKMIDRPYEDLINTAVLDDREKRSGKNSLKLTYNGTTEHSRKVLRPWGVGTVKDAAGVFSVWMKAEREDFPVSISYGGKPKTVKVGKEWKRYEVVNPKLPAPSVYSPVQITFREQGSLWVDDLQAEFIAAPTEEELKSEKTFATPYRPSELDKSRFGEQRKAIASRPSEITIPKLPAGIEPLKGLDTWMKDAAKVGDFYNGEKLPKSKTEGYLACDNRNFYVGARCYVDDLKKASENKNLYGKQGEIFEILTEPIASGRQLASFQFIAYADGSSASKGMGFDNDWKGNWRSVVKLNEKNKSVDFTLAIPFSDFAHPEMKSRWLMNLHRINPVTQEVVTLIQSSKPSFLNSPLWPFAEFPEDVVKPYAIGVSEGGYSPSAVTLDLVNKSGEERQVAVKLTAGDISQEKKITLKEGVNSVSFPIKVENPKVEVRLEEKGAPLSNQLCLLEKREPISILGRLSFYMNESDAPFRVKTNVTNPEKLTAVLRCGDVSVKKKAAAKFQIALPLEDIPDGTHKVTLTLVDESGENIAQTSSELIKRPSKKGAAQVNHFSRSLMHDGKPVVPFAPFQTISTGMAMTKKDVDGFIDLLDRYGFKYAHILFNTTRYSTKEDALVRYFLEQADRKGIKVILWSQYWGCTDEEIMASRQTLDLPCILTQMVLDEPELGIPSDKALAFLRKMRSFFPYQPTQMNNTVLGIPRRYANLETDILMLDDYLTNRENRTVQSVVDNADIMWNAGAVDGKPCWYFIVGNNTSLHYREPTYSEQIAQTYGCIAAGCTGFSYFYGWPATNGNWKAYLQLNREIQALTNIMTSEDEITSATATGDPKLLRCLTKKHDGHLYLITCNIDENPTGEVNFTLPSEFQYADSAEVMFENRNLDVKNGKFSDEFPGHTRHVYKIKIK